MFKFWKMLSQRPYKTLAALQCTSRLFLLNFHPAGGQLSVKNWPAGGQQAATFHQGGGQIYIRLAASRVQISFGWSPATCKLLINLGILYCMAASRMQFASGWRLAEWNLHLAGGQLNEIYIRLVANWMINTEQMVAHQMQILQKYAASTLLSRWGVFQACWDYIFINHNIFRRNKNIQTKCDPYTGKALSNHDSFSPFQSHETVPLKKAG